jgi:hypothetical protein
VEILDTDAEGRLHPWRRSDIACVLVASDLRMMPEPTGDIVPALGAPSGSARANLSL